MQSYPELSGVYIMSTDEAIDTKCYSYYIMQARVAA